jgi:adenylate kinase
MNLVMLGPPGAGKGTQAARLSRAYRIPSIATGDILRAQVAAATPLGRRARPYLEQGELIPDAFVVDIIRDRLSDPDTSLGFILDGSPRTVPQAQALDALLDELNRPLDAVIYLDVEQLQTLVQRLGLRAEVDGRSDDRPDVIAHRIEVFRVQTAPLIDYYRGQGKLRPIDGDQPPDKVFTSIELALGTDPEPTPAG